MKALAAVIALAAASSLAHAQATHSHQMLSAGELKWNDAPSVGPGAKIAVIAVPFTFRLKLPANMKVAPHVHPAFERVTVLAGTFHFAHGETYDETKTRALAPGDVAIMAPGAPMFGFTREETVIQLHGVGPWGINYLNPADDPRRK